MFLAAILASVGMGATATNRVSRPGAVTRARPLHTVRRRREQSLRPPEAHSLPACPMRFERQSNPITTTPARVKCLCQTESPWVRSRKLKMMRTRTAKRELRVIQYNFCVFPVAPSLTLGTLSCSCEEES